MAEQIKINSTEDAITDFLESVLWADIERELKAWKEGFQIELESIVDDAAEKNPSTASVLMHLGDLNGRQKAIDYVLQLPSVLLTIVREQNKDR